MKRIASLARILARSYAMNALTRAPIVGIIFARIYPTLTTMTIPYVRIVQNHTMFARSVMLYILATMAIPSAPIPMAILLASASEEPQPFAHRALISAPIVTSISMRRYLIAIHIDNLFALDAPKITLLANNATA
jgi:hypothetical protein